ncbi:MAG: hypothetical protein L6V93_17275 [Clostridiales bacterium]|nr:MAG: hypothetical protein L6V93_17275 [Clostridiales bacterium]
MLSEESASRTIVFDKGNTPALSLNDKQKEAVKNAELLLVDGNEMSAAVEAARIAKRKTEQRCFLDAGGLYDGIKRASCSYRYFNSVLRIFAWHYGRKNRRGCRKNPF